MIMPMIALTKAIISLVYYNMMKIRSRNNPIIEAFVVSIDDLIN